MSRRRNMKRSLVVEEKDSNQEQETTDDEPQQFITRRGRGRGRGRGRRGRRVLHAQEFARGEEERLRELHSESSAKANDLIDQLTEDEAKTLLKEMSSLTPQVILEVSDLLTRRLNRETSPPPPPPPETDVPSWCVCNHCTPKNAVIEMVCCEMRPELCLSQRPEMSLVILDPFTLHLQQRFRNDIFARDASTPQDINRSYRHAAYRQFILWIHGRLHREDRRVVPSCCVKVIRNRYPDSNGHYKGFVAAHGPGW